MPVPLVHRLAALVGVAVGAAGGAIGGAELRALVVLVRIAGRMGDAARPAGPVLLAAEESGPRTDWRQVALDASDIGKSITGDPATLRFAIGDVVLKPFYETYGRHSVYLHVTLK